MREALGRLEAEGFVVTRPHRGAVVVRAERARLWENAQIRAALESLAAGMAAEKLRPRDLEDIRRLQARHDATDPESREAGETNRRFHFRIYEAAQSPVLLRLLGLLWQSLSVGPHVYRAHPESARQHELILEALAARDSIEAARLTEEHILGTAEVMRAKLQ